jgi:hypothetical protein
MCHVIIARGLRLLPDNEVIGCDYLGNPLRGLPFTAKATLYKGTQEITTAMELVEAARVEIIHYPGNIFDPMLGDFYPTLGYPVAWTLINAPAGVAIDRYGLIEASSTAQLGDVNEITVQAAYHGRTYEALFGITKARGGTPGAPGKDGKDGKDGDRGLQGDPSPRYRGVTSIADTGNTGKVTLKLGGEIIANVGDWVAYVGETVDDWQKGHCLRWNGTSWADIPIKADGNFDTNPYVAALMDLTEGAPEGTFMSILVRDLIAKTAIIEYIASHKLHIQEKEGSTGAIFGGERFTKSGDSVIDNGEDKTGFMMGTDGRLIASNAIISGTVNADSGIFNGTLVAGGRYNNNGTENTSALSGIFVPKTGAGNQLIKMRGAHISGAINIGSLGSQEVEQLNIVSHQVILQYGINSQLWYHGIYTGRELFLRIKNQIQKSYKGTNYRMAVRGQIGGLSVTQLTAQQDINSEITSITFYGTTTDITASSITINDTSSAEATNYTVSIMLI